MLYGNEKGGITASHVIQGEPEGSLCVTPPTGHSRKGNTLGLVKQSGLLGGVMMVKTGRLVQVHRTEYNYPGMMSETVSRQACTLLSCTPLHACEVCSLPTWEPAGPQAPV